MVMKGFHPTGCKYVSLSTSCVAGSTRLFFLLTLLSGVKSVCVNDQLFKLVIESFVLSTSLWIFPSCLWNSAQSEWSLETRSSPFFFFALSVACRSPWTFYIQQRLCGWAQKNSIHLRCHPKRQKPSRADAGWRSWKNRLSPVQTIFTICSQSELRVQTRFITGPIRGKD